MIDSATRTFSARRRRDGSSLSRARKNRPEPKLATIAASKINTIAFMENPEDVAT